MLQWLVASRTMWTMHACLQVVSSDLISASVGIVAALLRAPADGVMWLKAAMLTVDVFARVLLLLDAASALPELDAAVVNAGWKRCREVRLPQNLAKVRAPNPDS